MITATLRKPRYTLDELLEDCDALPMDAEWDAMPPVGSEVL